jgi:hypothetical protein
MMRLWLWRNSPDRNKRSHEGDRPGNPTVAKENHIENRN